MSKFSANGSLIWERVVEPAGVESWSSGFCIEDDGGFTTVRAQKEGGTSIPWLGRFDDSGDLMWERTFEVPGLYLNFHLIERDPLSGYYVEGSDHITVYTNMDSRRDVFAHVDPSGNLDWMEFIGGYDRYKGSFGFKVIGEMGILSFGLSHQAGALPGVNWRARFVAISSAGDSLTTVEVGHQLDSGGYVYSTWVYDTMIDCVSERVLAVGGVKGTWMQNWTTDEDRWLFMVDISDYQAVACPEAPELPALDDPVDPIAYPNPIRPGDQLNIQLPGIQQRIILVEVVALDGRVTSVESWRESDGGTIELNSPIEEPGIYFIRAVVDGAILDLGKVLVLQ